MTNLPSQVQLFFIIIINAIGIGIVFLPELGTAENIFVGCILTFLYCIFLSCRNIENTSHTIITMVKALFSLRLVIITAGCLVLSSCVLNNNTSSKVNQYVLIAVLFALVVYSSFAGAAATARAAVFTGIMALAALFIGFIASCKDFSLNNINYSLSRINPINALLVSLSMGIMEPVFFLKSQAKKTILFSAVGIFLIIAVIILLTGCYGENTINISPLRMLYTASFFNIFSRSDGIYLGVWLFCAIVYCSTLYNTACELSNRGICLLILFVFLCLLLIMLYFGFGYEKLILIYGKFCLVSGIIYLIPLFFIGRNSQ